MSDVKKENEKRTTRYIDRTGNSGLVNSNKIVSRKQILANKSSNFSTGRANDFHRFSVTHGSGSSRPPTSGGLLPGSHPMLDRNSAKHKRAPVNSEIMKRPLRYIICPYFLCLSAFQDDFFRIAESGSFTFWLLDPIRNRS